MNKSKKKRERIRLKPCPFCGYGKPKKHTIEVFGAQISSVRCPMCGATTGTRDEPNEAIAAWNLRAGESQGVS
jgi:Lar family restriction alleviation protein